MAKHFYRRGEAVGVCESYFNQFSDKFSTSLKKRIISFSCFKPELWVVKIFFSEIANFPRSKRESVTTLLQQMNKAVWEEKNFGQVARDRTFCTVKFFESVILSQYS